MFDFAISSSKKRRPSRRLYASWIASCVVHALMLLTLIQFPQLLRGGMYHRFRPVTLLQQLMSSYQKSELDNSRIVTLLRPMKAPSEATLKKYLYDWDKKEANVPPIRLRWDKEQREILAEKKPPVQKPAEEPKLPKPSPPPNEVAASAPAAARGPGGGGGTSSDTSSSGSSVVSVQNDSTRKGSMTLPPPASAGAGKNEIAGNNAPSAIPNSVKPPSNTTANGPKVQNGTENLKVFENEQQAIRSPQGGFFDTKGFPLGEYTHMIVELIKGKWFIPSNLRNSQGHTTVVFFIDRQGRLTDARIVGSSGSTSLDFAALNAIIESNPAPPLPKGFPGDRVGAKFIFSYNEPQ
jgi:TonB family protein